jgi:repressor LexA
MELKGKSRREVCAALGFSYYTFSDWVNGKKYPRMDKVEMLADYFGISKSDLIEEKGQPTEYDGLSTQRKALIDFAMSVPDDKAEMILRVMKSIVESD